MRILVAFYTVALAAAPCAAAPSSRCPDAAAPAFALGSTQSNALALLGSFTELLSPLGMPVLASNYVATVAINNESTPGQRAQALVDATITDSNANVVADGLGRTMGEAYRRQAKVESATDGAPPVDKGEVAPEVTALINAVNMTSAGDSGVDKCAYASGRSRWMTLPAGGAFDVIGKAYGHPAGTFGADYFGDSRPFQTAPLWATSGPGIKTYDGLDFYRTPTNSRLVLMGTTSADKSEHRTGSDLTDSPSFPSGHTTYGYTESLLLAMMVPERYQALAYRGSEYGDSRIVIGAHYPIDVIAGRTLATYDLAQDLAGTASYASVGQAPLKTALAAAAARLRTFLQENGCPDIAACAARDPIARADNARLRANGLAMPVSPATAYVFRLNYGLPPMGATDRAPEPVPAQAAALLATRFPYLTPDQRREILRTTEGPSGYFLDVDPLDGAPLLAVRTGPEAEVGFYARANLFAAAGGYGAFDADVEIDQDEAAISDPDLGPFRGFAQIDAWTNDIGGAGGLRKRGTGRLVLTGRNTYRGATIVQGGTLEIDGSVTSQVKVETGAALTGSGRVRDLAIAQGATLDVVPAGALRIDGALQLASGSVVAMPLEGRSGALRVGGKARLDGARLTLRGGGSRAVGANTVILTAEGGIEGTFGDVAVDVPSRHAKLTYDSRNVFLTVEDARTAPPATAPVPTAPVPTAPTPASPAPK